MRYASAATIREPPSTRLRKESVFGEHVLGNAAALEGGTLVSRRAHTHEPNRDIWA
jgi:hypothetical protein